MNFSWKINENCWNIECNLIKIRHVLRVWVCLICSICSIWRLTVFFLKTLERRWQFVVGLDFVCFNLLKNSPTALIFHCMLSQFHWVAHGLFHHLPKSHQCSKFEFERWYLIGCSTFWYFVDAIFNRWQVWTSAENQLISKKTSTAYVCVCVYGMVIDWNWFAP